MFVNIRIVCVTYLTPISVTQRTVTVIFLPHGINVLRVIFPPPGKYFQSLVNKKENLKTILNDGASFYYYAYIRLNARKADLSKGRWNPTKKIGGYHALSRDNGA